MATGLVAVLAVSACGGDSRSVGTAAHPTPSASAPTTSPADPVAPLVAQVDVGQQPCAVVGGFGSIWVALISSDTVLRIDPATRKVLRRIRVPSQPCGMAIGGGSVWIEDYGDGTVTRVDGHTSRVTTRIKAGVSPYDVHVAFGAAWVTNYGDNTVTRVDLKTNRGRSISAGSEPTGVASAGGAVWVTNQGDGTLTRIDPTTLRTRPFTVGGAPTWTAWTGPTSPTFWISNGVPATSNSGTVQRIDARTGRVTENLKVPAIPNDGDVVTGTLWVPLRGGGLAAWSATTNKLLGRWSIRGVTNPFGVVGYLGKLWVVDYKGTTLTELDPSVLLR
jgi:YVTN family beta-propeller protein